MTKTYKIRDTEDGSVYTMTLPMILEELNRDRSEEWTDYDETDWREGLAHFTTYEVMTEYTAEDYNVTIQRGFVREDGKILWGLNPRLTSGLEWRTPEAFRKNVKQKKANHRKRYQLHKTAIDDIKRERGCEVCGFGTHKYAKKWRRHVAMLLEFDHIDPSTKSYNVCDMASYAWKMIQTEIDKCRVVCKPCHTEHTGNQNRKDETND